MNRAEKRRQQKLASKAAKAATHNTPLLPHKLDVVQMLDLALHHHASGSLIEAKSICRNILKVEPNQPLALLLSGIISREMGELNLSLKFIKKVLKLNPEYVEAQNHLGLTYMDLGRYEDAMNCYQSSLTLSPDFIEGLNNLGNALKELGRLDEAVTCFQRVLKIDPLLAIPLNNLGNVLVDLGLLDKAVSKYRKAVSVQPEYVDCYCNLGHALLKLDQIEDANTVFSKALSINPDSVQAHSGLGLVHLQFDRYDEAETSFKTAIAIKPDFAEGHSNLLDVLEKTNKISQFRDALEDAKKNCRGSHFIDLVEAQQLKIDGDLLAARNVLEGIDGQFGDFEYKAERLHLLGDVNNRLGEIDLAYKYFLEGNRQTRQSFRASQINENLFIDRIEVLSRRFSYDWVSSWKNIKINSEERADPVFLVGFPRSGTTLLDTILRSHPGISVSEELPTVQKMRLAFETISGGSPDGMRDLSSIECTKLRQVYFTELHKHLDSKNISGVFVDRMPFNLVEAGLIHRVFPKAKFVFVQRHPCDCVLSCFMQKFIPNAANVNFFTLNDAANLFNQSMSLWQQYQELLPIEVFTVRYENLIEDFEATLNPLLSFLDVEWDNKLYSYTETAKSRKKIKTASYNQVTQPLYSSANGRWKKYSAYLGPFLPILSPWVELYGYDG